MQAGGTLVFLMGVTALPDIVKGLLDAGMDPQMPSAVIQEGTLAGQRKVLAPLAELLEACRKEEIQPHGHYCSGSGVPAVRRDFLV